MTRSRLNLILVATMLVSACGAATATEGTPGTALGATEAGAASSGPDAAPVEVPLGRGQGMGGSSGMAGRHQAPIPAAFAGAVNPVPADAESLARGAEAYAVCANCHGDTGLGDGAAGAGLDPAPVNVAHTSQMMGDDYLFWRITEGGIPFQTAMPAWGALDETTRWDLVNYLKDLGQGSVAPGQGRGRGPAGPRPQTVPQTALLEAAVELDVITENESDLFSAIHDIVDARMSEARTAARGTRSATLLADVLSDLVETGDLTQDEADSFVSVHDRLSAAGLVP